MSAAFSFLAQEPFGSVVAIVLGLLWGSFFNVCIFRMPIAESVAKGRSRCPRCAKLIAWYDNIPVFSYAFLRGKCRRCREPISLQYPLVELLTALLYWILYRHYGLGLSFFAYAIFISNLLILSVIDLKHRIIPDELSLGGAVVGFLFSFVSADVTWMDSLLGAALGGGAFFAIAFIYKRWKGIEGLGGGDVKLLAMIGAWLGYQSLLWVVVLSSAVGTVVGIGVMVRERKGMKTSLPFGPFLAAAALLYLLFAPQFDALLYPS